MTDFRLKPIVVLVLALLVPILLAGCGDSGEDARPELSRSELQEIVQGELVKAPSVDPGLILEDVEEAIQAATGRTTGQEPGPTYGEVEAMVEAALTGLWEQGPGLTRGDVEVVRAVIAEMSEPEPGLDRAEVQRIARTCPLCRKRRRPQDPLKGLAVGRQPGGQPGKPDSDPAGRGSAARKDHPMVSANVASVETERWGHRPGGPSGCPAGRPGSGRVAGAHSSQPSGPRR